jgi:hypothetical protein
MCVCVCVCVHMHVGTETVPDSPPYKCISEEVKHTESYNVFYFEFM